jgi:hypothetical protein
LESIGFVFAPNHAVQRIGLGFSGSLNNKLFSVQLCRYQKINTIIFPSDNSEEYLKLRAAIDEYMNDGGAFLF